jgi:GTP cyclohydrolase II
LQEQGRGVLLYLRQEGRGIGLAKKISAYALQEQGLDTVEANHVLGLPEDMRDYRVAAEMLLDLGVRRARLLTNNPAKIEGLERYGVEVVERLPLGISPNPSNLGYLRTKREKMGHLFPMAVALEVVREVSA